VIEIKSEFNTVKVKKSTFILLGIFFVYFISITLAYIHQTSLERRYENAKQELLERLATQRAYQNVMTRQDIIDTIFMKDTERWRFISELHLQPRLDTQHSCEIKLEPTEKSLVC
jgi:hypothetical protein